MLENLVGGYGHKKLIQNVPAAYKYWCKHVSVKKRQGFMHTLVISNKQVSLYVDLGFLDSFGSWSPAIIRSWVDNCAYGHWLSIKPPWTGSVALGILTSVSLLPFHNQLDWRLLKIKCFHVKLSRTSPYFLTALFMSGFRHSHLSFGY